MSFCSKTAQRVLTNCSRRAHESQVSTMCGLHNQWPMQKIIFCSNDRGYSSKDGKSGSPKSQSITSLSLPQSVPHFPSLTTPRSYTPFTHQQAFCTSMSILIYYTADCEFVVVYIARNSSIYHQTIKHKAQGRGTKFTPYLQKCMSVSKTEFETGCWTV